MSEDQRGFFTRAKDAVKSFFSHALGSIPRVMIFNGLAFAASAAAGSFIDPSWNILGVDVNNTNALIGRYAKAVALSSALSGVIGTVFPPAQPEAAEPAAPTVGGPQRTVPQRGLGQQRSLHGELPAPQRDLPMMPPTSGRPVQPNR